MRTKRSTGSKKPAARAAKAKVTVADAPKKKTSTWIAGIDGISMGIAAAVIVGAGILVAAYKPAPRPAEAASAAAAVEQPAPPVQTAADARAAAAIAKAADEPAGAASEQWPAPLTITGCLERDADAFRLTETSGVGAPKARSWKSGFLKKSSSPITVVDADRRSRLQDHVGRRVSVTGTMINREIQLGSIRRLSESCSQKTKV